MKTLALSGGDLVVSTAGHKTITGGERIRQDLQLALSEPYGDDRFHRDWGSTLPRYIGQLATLETEMMIEVEINRILRYYIAVQQNEIMKDSSAGLRTRFTTADIIAGVLNIKAAIQYDTIYVQVVLVTQGGETITLNKEVQV